MNDEFEQKLSRQTLRKIPGEWRAEILSVATRQNPRVTPQASFLSTLNHQLSTIFWPNQKAWGVLATVWIFIFVVNFSIRDKSPVVAEKSAPPSPEVVAELKREKILFAEWFSSSDAREAEPLKFFPRPRTERAEILTA